MPMIVNEPLSKVDTGDREVLVVELDGDANYLAGGYPFVAPDLPFRVQNRIESVEGRSLSGTYYALYDPAADTLLWFVAATAVEVVAATDLSAETLRCVIRGR